MAGRSGFAHRDHRDRTDLVARHAGNVDPTAFERCGSNSNPISPNSPPTAAKSSPIAAATSSTSTA
jgi:hypothetical protein